MKKSGQNKKTRGIKEIKKVAQVMSIALFSLCVDTSFAYWGSNTLTFQKSWGQQLHEQSMLNQQLLHEQRMQFQNQIFQMQQQERILNKQEHLQKLSSDPEYVFRDKLNTKSYALGRVIKESDEKFGTLDEKEKILSEEFGLLFNPLDKLDNKVKPILARLDTLIEKQKTLDKSKLMIEEKEGIKNFLLKVVELYTKRQEMSNKWKAYNDKVSPLNENFAKKMTDFVNILQKYNTEMEKYQYKIEYDNKAYEAYLNIAEKKAEAMLNAAREKEVFILKQEKIYEEADKLITENIKFCKEIIKHKSFVRKYERFFKKVEKRLGV